MRAGIWKRLSYVLAAAAVGVGATLAGASPAQAAWEPQIPVTLQASANGQQVGYASGWVQFETDGTTFRYELTACRQSSYTTPYLTVGVNAAWYGGRWNQTHVASLYPSYNGWGQGTCYGSYGTVSGQHTLAGGFTNVRFSLFGNTFVGSEFVVDEDDAIYYD